MTFEAARKKDEYIQQEILNYYENEAIREQENSRKGFSQTNSYILLVHFFSTEIDLFEVRLGRKHPSTLNSTSEILTEIDEMEKLGIRKARFPDLEPFIYDTETETKRSSVCLFLFSIFLYMYIVLLVFCFEQNDSTIT